MNTLPSITQAADLVAEIFHHGLPACVRENLRAAQRHLARAEGYYLGCAGTVRIITIVRPVDGGCEVTHFEKVRGPQRREEFQGDEHVSHHTERGGRAQAVSKFIIPSDPQAVLIPIPLQDETGVMESLNERDEVVKIPVHEVKAMEADPYNQPISHP